MTEQIENDFLKVEVSYAGAELKSLYNKTNKKEYLWQANPEFWPRRAPVLFPFVGKLKNNQFKYKGQSYTMSQHGFARDQKFELKEKTTDSLLFSLKSNEHLLQLFPFEFELNILYKLTGKKLDVQYVVNNPGKNDLYFSIGGHPGFNCPLFADEDLEDYCLEFENSENAESLLTDGGLINSKTKAILNNTNLLPLSEEIFDIDTIIFEKLKSSYVVLKNKKGTYKVKVQFGDFPVFAIWKKADANFLCLEPWDGHGDLAQFDGELNGKKGIHSLSSGKTYSKNFFVEIA
jgi:galactose mutarotase-like enzyme